MYLPFNISVKPFPSPNPLPCPCLFPWLYPLAFRRLAFTISLTLASTNFICPSIYLGLTIAINPCHLPLHALTLALALAAASEAAEETLDKVELGAQQVLLQLQNKWVNFLYTT